MNRGDSDPAILLDGFGIKSRDAVTRVPAVSAEEGKTSGAGQNMGEAIAIAALIPSIIERLAAQMQDNRYSGCEREDDGPPHALSPPVIAVRAITQSAAEGVGGNAEQDDCGDDESDSHAANFFSASTANSVRLSTGRSPVSNLEIVD